MPQELKDQLLLALGRLEGKQDLVLQRLQAQDKATQDVESRVMTLERKVNYGAGVFATVAFLWYAIGDLIKIKLGL